MRWKIWIYDYQGCHIWQLLSPVNHLFFRPICYHHLIDWCIYRHLMTHLTNFECRIVPKINFFNKKNDRLLLSLGAGICKAAWGKTNKHTEKPSSFGEILERFQKVLFFLLNWNSSLLHILYLNHKESSSILKKIACTAPFRDTSNLIV